tara:strand:- start:201 stop:761 length:561 start_codon:yes stop_codon:yes gene_type:complete
MSVALGGAPSVGLDKISAFEHLQCLIANGPDLEDLDAHDDLMTRLAAFCKSGELLCDVQAFCTQHADEFAEFSGGEYPLSWTALHASYSKLIEQALEGFLASQHCSADAFYAECRSCLDRSRSDSRWNRDALIVSVFLASNEFEEWAALMSSVAVNLADEDDEDARLAPPDEEDGSQTQQSPVALH